MSPLRESDFWLFVTVSLQEYLGIEIAVAFFIYLFIFNIGVACYTLHFGGKSEKYVLEIFFFLNWNNSFSV